MTEPAKSWLEHWCRRSGVDLHTLTAEQLRTAYQIAKATNVAIDAAGKIYLDAIANIERDVEEEMLQLLKPAAVSTPFEQYLDTLGK